MIDLANLLHLDLLVLVLVTKLVLLLLVFISY